MSGVMSCATRTVAALSLTLAITCVVTPASARRAFTTQQILDLCRFYERDLKRADRPWHPHTLMCTSYWVGVLDTIAAFDGAGQHDNKVFALCMPETLTLAQANATFVKHARANPKELRTPAMNVALAAFRESYACR